MAKGPKGEKRPADTIGCAVKVAKIATGEIEDNGYRVPARTKSGVAGAKARTEKLVPEKRAAIARKAAETRWQKRRGNMVESGIDKLHTLLFNEGRELVNIKFLPGSDRGLTPERLRNAAAAAVEAVLRDGAKDNPPQSGQQKSSLRAAAKIQN